jgi:hypothetical protein
MALGLFTVSITSLLLLRSPQFASNPAITPYYGNIKSLDPQYWIPDLVYSLDPYHPPAQVF